MAQDFASIAGFPGVLGSLDCSHIKIVSPGGDDAERFRCRKGFFSINMQTVCDAQLLIRDIVARWPGSAHDSTIFDNSRLKVYLARGDLPYKYHVLGDSGYALEPYLMTPILNPLTQSEIRYNASQILTRNTVERKYGVLKRRFPCLSLGLRCDVDKVPAIIVATAVLHNMAVKLGVRAEAYSSQQARQPALHTSATLDPEVYKERSYDLLALLKTCELRHTPRSKLVSLLYTPPRHSIRKFIKSDLVTFSPSSK